MEVARPAHRARSARAYCSRHCYHEGRRIHPDEVRERRQARARAWRERNADRVREYRREQTLRNAYGIGVADYERMYSEQAGRCAICGEPHNRLDVDHCHATGTVRGLLCRLCNQGLGNFMDRSDLLDSAKLYLAGAAAILPV